MLASKNPAIPQRRKSKSILIPLQFFFFEVPKILKLTLRLIIIIKTKLVQYVFWGMLVWAAAPRLDL